MKNSKISFIFIGLALFAMFFGSGNLTFPLYIGQIAKQKAFLATMGFSISAVLLPFLGIMVMLFYQGDYEKFFQSCSKYISGKYKHCWIRHHK